MKTNPALMSAEEYKAFLVQTEGPQAKARDINEVRAQHAAHRNYLDNALKAHQTISAVAFSQHQFWGEIKLEQPLVLPEGYAYQPDGEMGVYAFTEPSVKP